MSAVLELAETYGTSIFTLKARSPALKQVYGALYHGKTKSWWFPAFFPAAKHVLSDLKKVVQDLEYSPEVEAHLKELEEYVAIPEDFQFITEPYQHQRDGVAHLSKYPRGGLFYSAGLGKCKITVDLQRLIGCKMLIACPLVMLSTWAEEFVKHGNNTNTLVISGRTKDKKLQRIDEATKGAFDAIIVTYGVANLYAEKIARIPYDTVVLDESHRLKSPFSQRTKSLMYLGAKANRRILLSGTPSLGSPFDLYAQLRFLGKYFCPEDWWAFRRKFGVFPASERDERVPKMLLGFKNMDIINTRVNEICIRRTKEECLDLPEQQIIDRVFELSAGEKRIYNRLCVEGFDEPGKVVKEKMESGDLTLRDGFELTPHVWAEELITRIGKLDQVTSGFLYQSKKNPGLCNECPSMGACEANKVKPYTKYCSQIKRPPARVVDHFGGKYTTRTEVLDDILDGILCEDKNKIIIWASLHAEIDRVAQQLEKRDIEFVKVVGGMSQELLDAAVAEFNTEPTCRVYLGQVSTGIGITLNAANYMVYYSLPWGLEAYLQSLDRNYRIGQTQKVTVYRMLARGSLDQAKAAALDQKIDFGNLVTSKSVCAMCPDYFKRCRKYKVELYDDECKFDRQMERKRAGLQVIV